MTEGMALRFGYDIERVWQAVNTAAMALKGRGLDTLFCSIGV